ncbi:hypothetical protein K491DRAFT_760030 [Lophiostoma macrostomum CBS 122681]|uniref:Uncharacterized protein n=1 Tax=Lophiostoma macrostomum CBS 122681 TaxID=1314788 RepID=A0A6A6T204_9PLEO|nr:hypothetical protein K491DRAFT_760030 [Lophiostoma macrostomum CBS 122681]
METSPWSIFTQTPISIATQPTFQTLVRTPLRQITNLTTIDATLSKSPARIFVSMSAIRMFSAHNISQKISRRSKSESKGYDEKPVLPSRPPYQSRFREEFDLVTAEYLDDFTRHGIDEPLRAYPLNSFRGLVMCVTSRLSGVVSSAKQRLVSKREASFADKVVLLPKRHDSEAKHQGKKLPSLLRGRHDSAVQVPESPDSCEYHPASWYLSQNKHSDYLEEYHTADWYLRGGRNAREWENDVYDPTWKDWETADWDGPVHLNASDSTLTVSDSTSVFADRRASSDTYSSLENPQPIRVQRIPLLETDWDVLSESVYSQDTDGQRVEVKSCSGSSQSEPTIGQVIPLAERKADWVSDDGDSDFSVHSSEPFMIPGVPIVESDADCRFCEPEEPDDCPLLFSGDDQACLARFAHAWDNPYVESIDQDLFADFDGAYGKVYPAPALDNTSRLRALAAEWLEGEEDEVEDDRDSPTFEAIQAEVGLLPPPPLPVKSLTRRRESWTPMPTPIHDEFVGMVDIDSSETYRISHYMTTARTRESWIPSYAYLSGSIN